ncbi:MAG TPA: hypothetical protein PLS00_02470 [Niabella sp.]|nr:hypothetical protein [Niabella sp.]
MADLQKAIHMHSPVAVLYNYHFSTLPWLTQKIIHTKYKSLNRHISIPQIGIMHEVTQSKADNANNMLFDYHIAPDPTLLLKNPIVFKTGRLIPEYNNPFPALDVPVIGSFGFATPNKGFEEIVVAVQKEFDIATIRFNIPAADFGDSDGNHAMELAKKCRQIIKKPGIVLKVTHDFLEQKDILDFLAQNSINVFLYQDKTNRGISSTPDYALAVNRPIGVSDSIMFRHLHTVSPSIVYGQSTLKQIIENGITPLKKIQRDWSRITLVWEYERIIKAILKGEEQKKQKKENKSWSLAKKRIRNFLGLQQKKFTWLRNTKSATDDILTVDPYQNYIPVHLPVPNRFNRILDNNARLLYKPTIEKLEELVPLTMAKKIPEANVQQAFIFDTVYRLSSTYKQPKILCVGSYEDTAAMSWKRLGFEIEEIDPVLNYYLQDFFSKPTTIKNSYDIIFSTSVIEHDPDDESFIKCIEGLLAPQGIAILTCDYKDGWEPGKPKPDVDARLYTKEDLTSRLPSYIPECKLIDKPQWDCEHPDFNYLGKYQYTFATFVIQKTKL